MFISESLIKATDNDDQIKSGYYLSAVTKVSPIMKTAITVNWHQQVSPEKSQGQVMTTVDKEQWHAPAFKVGK